jgi:GT2 family glycosyltransferase
VPELSVVVPVLERYDQLERMLDHLARQTASPDSFEVVVANDAAEPDPGRTEAAIGERPYATARITAPAPGAAWARQVGWQRASGAIVLFLDSDVLAEPRLVAEHLDWHRRHPEPEVAVLGSLRWADELRVTAFMRWIERGIQFDFETIAGEDAGWGRFYTANASVKRALLERVGGFDAERFPFHYEDLELAYRMNEHGLRLLYNRDASAEHLHAVTLESYKRRMAEVAPVERRFVAAHPDVEPYFHDRFARAAARPPARGTLAPLVRWVSPGFPWLGERAWRSADHYYEGELAPGFLAAWDSSSGGGSPGPK